MKIRTISFPSENQLEKVNPLNDNIDVFVETEDGERFAMTVCTPHFYNSFMEKEKLHFLPAAPPDVIVEELTYENIEKALQTYCEDNGYWMKLYFLAGSRKGVFSEENLDALLADNRQEEAGCCHQKGTPRQEKELKQLKNRISRIVGQLNGIGRMLDENRYCGDILTQVAAVESALQSFGYLILQEHMETCVVEEIGKGNLGVIEEAVELVKKLK